MPTAGLPPLVLAPLPVPRPWGGHRAHAIVGECVPSSKKLGPIGEWWLLTVRADHTSSVCAGPLEGQTLAELLAVDAEGLVGTRLARTAQQRFPLLLKILDTAAPLSIQVHPSDADLPGEGKTESWYFLSAEAGASFWLGVAPGHRPEEVIEQARRGRAPESLLAHHAARAGLVAHVPPGTIHALGAGIVAVEFQTSADTTYRIWDWGRLPPRPLHVDQAMRVARSDARAQVSAPSGDLLVACDAYHVERMRVEAPVKLALASGRFEVLLPLDGAVQVAGEISRVEAPRGHACLVPASTKECTVSASKRVELLRFVPGPAIGGKR
jgi:mannose-6-phosphate isomerase